jgi:hypothetical protein
VGYLGPVKSPDISIDGFCKKGTAERAFQETEYESHGGEDAFWSHLKEQKEEFDKNPSKKFPFFAIIQSSGYGKSRLIEHLRKSPKRTLEGLAKPATPEIVYFSFASDEAYPKSNVKIEAKLHETNRDMVEKAFLYMFEEALNNPKAESFSLDLTVDQ